MKQEHLYKVTVAHLWGPRPGAPLHDTLQFETANHDDILGIADRLRDGTNLDAEEAASLAVGLKLFGEVALKHRDDPLFASINAPLREFTRNLKARTQTTQ